MKMKPFVLLIIILFAGSITQAHSENDVNIDWVSSTEFMQDMNVNVDIKISNNSPNKIFAKDIIIHYSWMQPNVFEILGQYIEIEPNTEYHYKYILTVPASATVGKSSDYAFLLSYIADGVEKNTALVRATINISVGKSIYTVQPIYTDYIVQICVMFGIGAIIIINKKEGIVNWLNLRKSIIGTLVFLVTFSIYVLFLSANFTSSLSYMTTQQGFPIVGDEPHYMLMSRAILSGKVDADNIYLGLDGTYRHYHYASGILFNGMQISNHPYGMPLLSAIPYYLGSVGLGSGAFGILIFMCALMALTVVLVYKISMYMTKDDITVSLITATTFALATTMFMWSGQFFTENFLSFFILFAVYKFMIAKSNKDWILGALALGYMPFVKYQTIFVLYFCTAIFILFYLKGKKELKYSILVLLGSIVAYLSYLFLFLGFDNVTMLGTSDLTGTERVINVFGFYISKTIQNGFFGLFLDRNYGLFIYSPILILSALGLVQAYRKNNFGIYIGTAIFVFWIGALSCFTDWMGWISIPGRYTIMVAPLLCIPFALGVKDFKDNKYYKIGFLGLFLAGLIPNVLIAHNRLLGFVMSIRNGVDYNWYWSAFEGLGFPTKWLADYNNIYGLNGANFLNVVVYAMILVFVVSAFILFSYNKTFLDSNNLENTSTTH